MNTSILSCKNLSYTIGYKKIFKNISFEIFSSEFTLLTGENGSGKTSLLKLILQSSRKKEFQWNVKSDSNNLLSYLGHENGIYSSLSLRENLVFFNRILKKPMPETQVADLVEKFQLTKRLEDPVSTFSEGMKKKSGIIRALLARPSLLLLDEPLNGLDTNSVQVFLKILQSDFADTSVLLVAHEIDKISPFVKRRLHLYKGELNSV